MGIKIDKNDPNVLNMGFLAVLTRVRAMEKKILKAKKIALTPKELHHLAIIKTHPELKQTEIIEFLDITKGTYSTTMKTLTTKGFIEQKPNPKDKRIKILSLTEKGEAVMLVNDYIREQIKKIVFQKVTQEEYEVILNFITRIND